MEDRLAMPAGVLFDHPGPATRARHRIYSIIGLVALLGLIAWVVSRLSATGQFAYDLWEPFITPSFIRAILVDGVLETLKMAFTAVLGAVVFGLIFGVAKLSDRPWIRRPAWLVVEFFRAVPVILLMIFFFYAVFGGLNIERAGYWAVVAALTCYNGAVLAEVFRAGVNAVPKGQSEAAYALGLRKTQVMNIILLPQAVKIMIPAIISQCVVALKDTSLGYIIVAPGLTRVGKAIFQQFSNHVPTLIVLAALYITINLVLTGIATLVQRRYVGEKTPLEVPMVGQDGGGAA
jgi:glutamate transport system permease protein